MVTMLTVRMLSSSFMNHWLETSKKNLIPLSEADDFYAALKEWSFTGEVLDHDDDDEIKCELCEHPELKQHFRIKNKNTNRELLVGSSCILRFDEIEILDSFNVLIQGSEERRSHLEKALKERLLDSMLEPIRKLWRLETKNQYLIGNFGKALKDGYGLSPIELLFLFERLQAEGISYNPRRYKLSLRHHEEQAQLARFKPDQVSMIKLAFSTQQRKKYAKLLS